MKKNLKLLIPFAIVVLTFSMPQVAQGTEDLSEDAEQHKSVKTQEVEQTAEEEIISFWSAGIDQNIQHVKDLQNYDLTYGELLRRLETMQLYYMKEEVSMAEAMLQKADDKDIRSLLRCSGMRSTWEYGGAGWHYITELQTRRSKTLSMDVVSKMHAAPWEPTYLQLPAEVKAIVMKKMENYEKLQGRKHPRWDEFSKM